MKTVNWGWTAPTPEDEWNLEVTDISQLKAACRRLLVNAFSAVTMNKEDGNDYDGPCWSSCGGFTVYAWPNNRYPVRTFPTYSGVIASVSPAWQR